MEAGFGGPALRPCSSRVKSKGWPGEEELRGLDSRWLVGSGEINLSPSVWSSGESSGGETHCFKGHPWCHLISHHMGSRASGYEWWEYVGPCIRHTYSGQGRNVSYHLYAKDSLTSFPSSNFVYLMTDLCLHLDVPKASQTQPI